MDTKENPKNPYIAGRPVEAQEMFFGRQDVFDFVRRNLIGVYQDNAIILYGQHRTGKTSTLKQMRYHLGQTHVCVYMDLEGMPLNGIHRFLFRVADAICKGLQTEGITYQPLAEEEFTRQDDPCAFFIEGFLRQIEGSLHGRRVLVMFDEATRLPEAVQAGELEANIFPYLGHLLQQQAVVDFIFCLGRQPREIDRDFARTFRSALYKEISLLEREPAFDLITRPVKGIFEYDRSAVEHIYRLTSGHPYFIQVLCHTVFNRWVEQPDDSRIDRRDVETALGAVIEAAHYALQDMWVNLADEEKAVLSVLAELISEGQQAAWPAIQQMLERHLLVLAPGQIKAALASLSESQVLQSEEPYLFRVDLFRRWIRDHQKPDSVRQEMEERAREVKRKVILRSEDVQLRYLKQVHDSCELFDFRGLGVAQDLPYVRLLDLFVRLHVTVEPSGDELFRNLALRAKARFLAEEMAAAGTNIPLAIRSEMADEMRRLAVAVERQRVPTARLLGEHRRVVILGDPGAGKTSFLRWLALTFAEGRKAVKDRLGLDAAWVPILIPVDAYAEASRQEPGLLLRDFLPRQFSGRELHLPELSAYFERELDAGHCLVLLDGLDMVIDNTERLRVVQAVDHFIENEAPRNRFVITSRIEGYQQARLQGDYLHCTVSDLEMPEIEDFASQWSLVCETQFRDTVEGRARAKIQASRLIEAIKAAPGVRRLAGNPLLLTVVALVHRQGRLPHHRITLYNECARTLIERWNQVRGIAMRPVGLPMDANEAMRNYAPLALWMHEEKRGGTVSRDELKGKLHGLLVERGIPEEDACDLVEGFVEMERTRTGLLVERGVNAYGFSHLTFQEYFAVKAIAARRDHIWPKLREHLHDPRWREVVLLTAGQLGVLQIEEETVTDLVGAIANNNSPLNNYLHRDLLLAGRCLADDVGVSYPKRARLLELLLDLWRTAGYRRLQQETDAVMAAMRGTACELSIVEALLAALDGVDTELCERAATTLGRMGMTSDKTLNALLTRLKGDQRPHVRAYVALALSGLNVAPERVTRALEEALQGDEDREVRVRAAEALAFIGEENEQAIDLLLTALRHKDGNVRGSAAAALRSIRKPSERLVDPLLGAMRDDRTDVRMHAAEVAGRLGQRSSALVNGLVALLRKPQEEAQISAAMALGQIGDTSEPVVHALIDCLADESRLVRKNAAMALSKLTIKSHHVVTALEGALADREKRIGAATALGRAERRPDEAKLAVRQIAQAELGAKDWRDRLLAVEALVPLDNQGWSSQQVVETLADVLAEEHRIQTGWGQLAGTAVALGEVAKRKGAPVSSAAPSSSSQASARIPPYQMVLELLSHKIWLVRAAAAEALGLAERREPEVVEALLKMLQKDENDHARGNAAAALGALGLSQSDIVDGLVRALGDPQGYVRVAAADALGKLGVRENKKVFDGLIGLLDDGYHSYYHDKLVRDAAFEALWVLAPYNNAELPM